MRALHVLLPTFVIPVKAGIQRGYVARVLRQAQDERVGVEWLACGGDAYSVRRT
ncbi:hypothetical protein AEB_P2911 [Altererythrobacter sp. B11]|nr:hypothetical protein AEB_P2911 [Altererythrobacter sp. B11]